MDKKNFWYGQTISTTDLRGILNATEQDVEWDFAVDMAATGVFDGLDVTATATASTSVNISTGRGRDEQEGKLTAITTIATLDCSKDDSGASTINDLVSGEGRWISVFIKWMRNESGLIYDNHGNPVYYNQDDGYLLYVKKATKGSDVDPTLLSKPALISGSLLLADIWIPYSAPIIVSGDINVDRRQDYYREELFGSTIIAGNPKDMVTDMATQANTLLMRVQGDSRLQGSFIPLLDNTVELGDDVTTKYFKDINTRKVTSEEKTLYKYISPCEINTTNDGNDWDLRTSIPTSAGHWTDALTILNPSGHAILPLSFLNPGDKLSTVEISWNNGTAIVSLTAKIFYTLWSSDTQAPTLWDTLTSSALATTHTTTSTASDLTIPADNKAYISFYGIYGGEKITGIKITYKRTDWLV